ncbi:TonB-dependent outer membrane protein, SusC/RagA [Gemmatirosa kalamazoonensis]|uniref:TonB-dependent outer membrane protein, SusC/RagA n=1 Tax=Gemmatirosa kalamazoonensis TaxID=861299 RepID=W0RL60_9BACT|nr:SusC/RagA family TonB-linked outer membrane protein [Gemmatirosa kalamazoonensis]AHG90168.1 TonB-dependent outer membrane protein, SusC/RagA [Gemmatirosa kalamazoonensis]
MTRWSKWLFLLTMAAPPSVALAQQGTGVVTGRVTQSGSGQPIPAAQVQIVGTTLGGLTNDQGRFTIRAVPARGVTVRVLRVGYGEQSRAVTVPANGTATVDFTLNVVSVTLTPVVVSTATGEQRSVEIGNSVSQINAAKVTETEPIRSVEDLLNAHAAGVVVTTGTQTGTGSRIRIRGQSSLNLSNDPIYVIDGIRMTSNLGSNAFGTGGSNASRTGDINPDEIESIEVVKGPSAATLYGTDAANGVVVITTKKGRAGPARWTVYGESGLLTDQNTYPYNYTIAGHTATSSAYRECTLPQLSTKACIMDSLRVYAAAHDPDATPIGNGDRYQTGAQLSGGNEVLRYFLSGEREGETGTLTLPTFERQRLDSLGLAIPDYTSRPNNLAKNTFRMNLNATVNPKLDLSLQSGFINLAQRYTLESNATAGLGSHLFGGPGYEGNCNVAVTPATPCHGYRAWTPAYTWSEKVGQKVNRFIASADANWRPFTWNLTHVTVGNDLTDRVDDDLRLRGQGPPLSATYRDGYKGDGRADIRNTTVNITSSATFTPKPWLNTRTSIGTNYVNFQQDQNIAEGQNLPPGAQTATAGANPTVTEATTLQKTLGFFVEEAVALNDRLFLTGALRSDQNSAFGTNFQRVIYPKASVSWLASQEGFFPKADWFNSLRLRFAYGASGVQPGPNDALRTFSATAVRSGATDIPAVTNNLLGNADLKPERSAEFEGGFEAKFFNNRLGLDFTAYQRKTRDALIAAIVAPSAGTGATTVRRNLGAIRNQGLELLANAQLVDQRVFGWDVSVNASTNSNKLLSLGGTPRQILTERQVVENYPLYGWWARPITSYIDKNGDGILTYNADPNLNEVFVGDTAEFRGYTQPRHLVTLTNGFEFLNRRLRLQSLLDYRGGYKAYNNTERIRCVSRNNCAGLMNPGSSLEEQAAVVATRDHPAKTLDGFFEDGTFLKLREMTLSYTLPQAFASRIRSRSAALVLTGRNLATWTKYRGVDPENDYTVTGGGDAPSDFQTVGPATYWIARISLGF